MPVAHYKGERRNTTCGGNFVLDPSFICASVGLKSMRDGATQLVFVENKSVEEGISLPSLQPGLLVVGSYSKNEAYGLAGYVLYTPVKIIACN